MNSIIYVNAALLELIRFLAWSAAWTPRFPIRREEGFKREIREPKKEMKRNAIKHFTEITFETELIPRSHRILWAHRKREKRWHIERKKRRQEGREEICRPSTVTRIKPGRHLKNGLQERKSSPLSPPRYTISQEYLHICLFFELHVI